MSVGTRNVSELSEPPSSPEKGGEGCPAVCFCVQCAAPQAQSIHGHVIYRWTRFLIHSIQFSISANRIDRPHLTSSDPQSPPPTPPSPRHCLPACLLAIDVAGFSFVFNCWFFLLCSHFVTASKSGRAGRAPPLSHQGANPTPRQDPMPLSPESFYTSPPTHYPTPPPNYNFLNPSG